MKYVYAPQTSWQETQTVAISRRLSFFSNCKLNYSWIKRLLRVVAQKQTKVLRSSAAAEKSCDNHII